ncbi:hypothetical protein ABMY26_00535 (plasmid) [Azospirillum sp. HJ39]|uniref:hypothetical protein n=1 Tax=Azospirillum sp. HJ39 TaxID=3159496 RepID=UPI0035561DD5
MLPQTTHIHRATFVNSAGGCIIERAEVAIHFSYTHADGPASVGSSSSMTLVDLLKVEILCGPGTSSRTTRRAPPHILSWAEHYCQDFAADLCREARAELADEMDFTPTVLAPTRQAAGTNPTRYAA